MPETECCEICGSDSLLIAGDFSSAYSGSRCLVADHSDQSASADGGRVELGQVPQPQLKRNVSDGSASSEADALQYVDISDGESLDEISTPSRWRDLHYAHEQIRLRKAELDHIRFQDDEYVQTIERILHERSSCGRAVINSASGSVTIEQKDSFPVAMAKLQSKLQLLRSQRDALQYRVAVSEGKREALAHLYAQRTENARRAKSLSVVLECQTILHKSLNESVKNQYRINKALRCRLAIKVFQCIPIHISNQSIVDSNREMHLGGCCTIVSLPLPNNGRFDDVALDILNSAIGHAVRLIDGVSVALNVPLPHPMRAFALNGISTISPLFSIDKSKTVYCLSPIIWHYSRDRVRRFNATTLKRLREHRRGLTQGSSGSKTSSSSSENAQTDLDLNEMTINEDFPEALTLLQANVITLCLKCGLQPRQLWPPEALLLNLSLLRTYLEESLLVPLPPHSSSAFDMNHPDVQALSTQLCCRFRGFSMGHTMATVDETELPVDAVTSIPSPIARVESVEEVPLNTRIQDDYAEEDWDTVPNEDADSSAGRFYSSLSFSKSAL